MNPVDLDSWYNAYMKDLSSSVPDGIFEVDLALLQELDLLECIEEEDLPFSQSFYVIESSEKLTLFNQKFVIWIVPKMSDQVPMTYTLIALNTPEHLQLEMVFKTSGVYNRSNLVLRVLEKFLDQIDENEQEMKKFKG